MAAKKKVEAQTKSSISIKQSPRKKKIEKKSTMKNKEQRSASSRPTYQQMVTECLSAVRRRDFLLDEKFDFLLEFFFSSWTRGKARLEQNSFKTSRKNTASTPKFWMFDTRKTSSFLHDREKMFVFLVSTPNRRENSARREHRRSRQRHRLFRRSFSSEDANETTQWEESRNNGETTRSITKSFENDGSKRKTNSIVEQNGDEKGKSFARRKTKISIASENDEKNSTIKKPRGKFQSRIENEKTSFFSFSDRKIIIANEKESKSSGF